MQPSSYDVDRLLAWRAAADARLRADDGWLTLAGLFWLRQGGNTVGTDPASDVVLVSPAPASVGRLDLSGDVVTFAPDSASKLTVDGAPADGPRQLCDDADGTPSVVALGRQSFIIIRRGERIGVRLRDNDSAVRQQFAGRSWFAPDPDFCFEATYTPYDPPKILTIGNLLGDSSQVLSPGFVSWVFEGSEHRLDASSLDSHGLHFVIRDTTSGSETYGALRFLDAPPPEDGRVALDFNYAVSPPCAFTAFATCPLPPPQNRLLFAVRAGERDAGHHADR